MSRAAGQENVRVKEWEREVRKVKERLLRGLEGEEGVCDADEDAGESEGESVVEGNRAEVEFWGYDEGLEYSEFGHVVVVKGRDAM
jgi:hypothetical protein